MDIKKDYVVFATTEGEGENRFVAVEKKPLSEVPNLVAGETKPVNAGDGYADWTLIEYRLKGLTGRILTVVDAAIPQGKQNKSIKDLIRSHIMDEYMYFTGELFDQEELNRKANESFAECDPSEVTQVTFEEILKA